MTIRNRLSAILGEQRITQTELHLRTGLSYTTITDLYHERAKRLDFTTLDKLCQALGVLPGDLLEYRP